MPDRIQRHRTKGWRMPEGAVYVGRPTKWGNPFRVGRDEMHGFVPTASDAVRHYRDWMSYPKRWALPTPPEIRSLQGHDLVCWCPLDQPCHADVLLDLANREEEAHA